MTSISHAQPHVPYYTLDNCRTPYYGSPTLPCCCASAISTSNDCSGARSCVVRKNLVRDGLPSKPIAWVFRSPLPDLQSRATDPAVRAIESSGHGPKTALVHLALALSIN